MYNNILQYDNMTYLTGVITGYTTKVVLHVLLLMLFLAHISQSITRMIFYEETPAYVRSLHIPGPYLCTLQ